MLVRSHLDCPLPPPRAPAPFDAHRDDLVVEPARRPRRFRPLLAGRRVLVALGAGDPVALRQRLRGLAHQFVGERTVEAVAVHPVLHRRVAEPLAEAHARQQVGRVAHALHAAGGDDLRFAEPHRVRRVEDRPEAGGAGLVDRPRRNGVREPGAAPDLPGRVRAGAGLPGVPEDHLFDRLRRHPGGLQRAGERRGPQLQGGHPGERAAELPDGRPPGAGENHRPRNGHRAEAAPPGREPAVPAAGAIVETTTPEGRETGKTGRGNPVKKRETATGNA